MKLRQKVLSVAAAMITGLTCANFLLLGYGGKVNPISLVFLASAIEAFFIGAFLIFLKKTVFSRLESHLKQLQEIAVSGDFNRRLGLGDNSYPRDDELTALGQEINRLLEKLEKTRDKLRQYEARLKITADNVRDLICLTDNSFKLQFVSPSVKSFLG